LHIRAAVVEAFVAFRGESWLFVVRFCYALSTVWSRVVGTVHDIRDDSSTISGDACMVIQDVTTIVLRLSTFCVRNAVNKLVLVRHN